MKQIYTSRNLTHCDIVRSILEGSGIGVILKNEFLANTAGASLVGTLGFAWPEIWVNDEDVEAATACLKDAGLGFLNSHED